MIFLVDFGTVPNMWYVFDFHFIAKIPTKKQCDESYISQKHKLWVVKCI